MAKPQRSRSPDDVEYYFYYIACPNKDLIEFLELVDANREDRVDKIKYVVTGAQPVKGTGILNDHTLIPADTKIFVNGKPVNLAEALIRRMPLALKLTY